MVSHKKELSPMVNVRGRDCKKESHDSTLSKGYEKVNNIDQMMMKYEEM
jgi:hypothetical protein